MAQNVEYIISLRDQFSSKLAGISKRTEQFGKKITSLGKTLSLTATLPILALGGTALKLAADFEETESKFFTVFSSIKDQADSVGKNLKNNFGLSSRAALQLLGDTGDLLVGFGFTETAALEMSQKVNELAVDLASFTNVQGGAETASAALTKALLGEREGVKSLGIAILESDVKARVLLNTQRGMTFASNRQAKAVATLQIATEQSSKAIGDFARTNQSFANQMRITRARLEDLAIQMGKILIPTAQKLLKIVKGWIQRFSALSPATKKIIVVVAGLVAALGPLLVVLGILTTTVLPALATAFTVLAGPIGLVVIAIGIAVFEIIRNWDKISKYFTTGPAAKTWKEFQKLTEKIFGILPKKIKVSTNLIKKIWDGLIQGLIAPVKFAFEFILRRVRLFVAIFGDIIDIFTAAFKGNWSRVWDEIKSIMARVLNFMIDSLRATIVSLLEIVQRPLKVFGQGEFIQPAIDAVNKLAAGFSFITDETEKATKAMDKLAKVAEKAKAPTAPGLTPAEIKAGIAPIAPGLTKVVSAAPKVFNITIDNLVETINNNVTNLKEGMNESKRIITEALLTALSDVQVNVR